MMKFYEIIPRKCVGDVSFGACLVDIESLGFYEDESGFDGVTNWKTYIRDGLFECYVKNDVVVCIACFKACRLNDEEITNVCKSDLISMLGNPDEIGDSVWIDDERMQIPFEYFSLGLQFWLENDVVVSVFCNDEY